MLNPTSTQAVTTRNVWIPMRDGVKIAATLMLPQGSGPFPVLASFYPYRKDDFIGASTVYARQYFADAGYASLLVDIRGYGSSDGPAYQAWDPREFEDGAEVVEWAARQDWCDGNVAIWGSSYGGAQALGIAAQRPPALKAIASVYGAADIYHDFVYPGGCPNGLGASAWSAFVVALELAPPSLQDPAGEWLDVWRSRLQRLSDGNISSQIWPAHRTHDDYWRERIIPVEAIEVPSFFLSGWRDLLCQGMLDAYGRCAAPKRLLAGPWSHAAPDAVAEAPYDWLLEIRHWFDRWLRNGGKADGRPDVLYYVQGADEWRTARSWPPQKEEVSRFAGAEGRLSEEAAAVRSPYKARTLVGADAGLWYPMGIPLGGAFDQSRDDARSLTFTSDPLDHDTVIAGEPKAYLNVELSTGAVTHLCVKLCHVAPDDSSKLITSGWLRVDPKDVADGSWTERADIRLYPTAYLVPRGHRLRWTIACADFPRIWPTAELPELTLESDTGAPSFVEIPIANGRDGDRFEPPAPPTGANRAPWLQRAAPICRLMQDAGRNGVSITAGMDMTIGLPQGGTMALEHTTTAELEEAHPAAAAIRTQATLTLVMASGEEIRVDTSGYATVGRRHLSGRITAGGRVVFDKLWSSFNGVAVV